jgi:hypothetical protein
MVDVILEDPEDVKSADAGYNLLIFRQIERINVGWAKIFSDKITSRRESMLELYLGIRALEAIMWARLRIDKKYKAQKEEILSGLFAHLKGDGLDKNMEFLDKLDAWYKLVTQKLDRFNFFPAIDVYGYTTTEELLKRYDLDDGKPINIKYRT